MFLTFEHDLLHFCLLLFISFTVIYHHLSPLLWHHLLQCTIGEYLLPFIPFITSGVFTYYNLFHLLRGQLVDVSFLYHLGRNENNQNESFDQVFSVSTLLMSLSISLVMLSISGNIASDAISRRSGWFIGSQRFSDPSRIDTSPCTQPSIEVVPKSGPSISKHMRIWCLKQT